MRVVSVLVLLAALATTPRPFPAAAAGEPAGEPGGTILRSLTVEPAWRWRGNLRKALPLREGEPLRPRDLLRALSLLRATGDMESLSITTRWSPEGADVVIGGRPVTLVEDVDLDGNIFVLDRELLPAVRTETWKRFDAGVAAADAVALRDSYARRGFFDAEVTVKSSPGEVTNTVRVRFRIREGKPGVVQKVEIAGNRQINTFILESKQRIIPLSFYDPTLVEETAERLEESLRLAGFLGARVRPEVTRVEKGGVPSLSLLHPLKSFRYLLPGAFVGVDIRFNVQEGERSEVRLEGVTAFDEAELRGRITFFRTGFFDEGEAEESRGALQAYYHDHGYPRAAVAVELDLEGRLAVFRVTENEPAAIERIDFRGNDATPSARLRELMESAPGSFGKRSWRANVLEKDLRLLRAHYLSRGYSRVAVRMEDPVFDADGSSAVVTVVIDEGPRTILRGVHLRGVTAFDPATVAASLGRSPGDPFDPSWAEQARRSILARYGRAGYADCRVLAATVISPDGSAAEVTLTVAEGERLELGSVLVLGNADTREHVLRRELGVDAGQPLDPFLLEKGRRRLQGLSFFSRAELVRPAGSFPSIADLVVRVRERPTERVSLALGYNTDEGYRGMVELGTDNLLGTGQSLRLQYRLSSEGQRAELVYRQPWFLQAGQEMDLRLARGLEDAGGYDIDRLGGRLAVQRRLGEDGRVGVAYRLERIEYRNLDPLLEGEPDFIDAVLVGGLSFSGSIDGRDSPVNPHRGAMVEASVELAAPALGGDSTFLRYELEAAGLLPLSKRSELVAAVRLGLIDPLDGEPVTPAERFNAGGVDTVRGFADRELGPRNAAGFAAGGTVLGVINTEWRFPIAGNFRGVVFVDGGNVWGESETVSAGDVRFSAGVGVRYDTPVGPVRLEVGRKLDPRPGEALSRFHFSLGYPF